MNNLNELSNTDPRTLQEFLIEAQEHLESCNEGLMQLTKGTADTEVINALFRSIHTIKGISALVGCNDIGRLSHVGENILNAVRNHELAPSKDVVTVLYETIDLLTSLLEDIDQKKYQEDREHEIEPVLEKLNSIQKTPSSKKISIQSSKTPSSQQDPSKPLSEKETQLKVFEQSAEQHIESIRSSYSKLSDGDVSDTITTTLYRSLNTLIHAAEAMDYIEFVEPANNIIDFLDLLAQGTVSLDGIMQGIVESQCTKLEGLLNDYQKESNDPLSLFQAEESLSPDHEHGEKALRPESATENKGVSSGKTIRIDQQKLDHYLNLSNELVISRNALLHTSKLLESEPGNLRALKSVIEGMSRIISDIQLNAMEMRMIPVKTVFTRVPKIVRDVARALEKMIEVQMLGEETLLDKQVAEMLGDPLVHIIRNAADHGIETPEIRRESGKEATGLITLKAEREGNFIVIEIQDNGAGINTERLKAKAVENEVITVEQSQSMTRSEALNLIFAPGLSTAKIVSDISGRGVGMDVVRNNITALNGTVSISSTEGSGTLVRIQLPLTLAVTTAILIEAGGETYALPMEAVKETVKLLPSELTSLQGNLAFSLRGQVIPLKRLTDLLDFQKDYQETPRNNNHYGLNLDSTGHIPVIVTNMTGIQFGLIVDDLKRQQEIVIKPLPSYLAQLPGLDSATIMGDGNIILVLNIAKLYDAALNPLFLTHQI